MNEDQLHELLFQALETERGGIQIYTTALGCALNDDLRQEWDEYLDQTTRHEQVVTDVITALGLDPETETPGRAVVRSLGESLVSAMRQALASGHCGCNRSVSPLPFLRRRNRSTSRPRLAPPAPCMPATT